jgi:hypothetical protein
MAAREQSPAISRLLGQAELGMYLLAVSLAAALLAERRVLARRGWAGEIVGIFEQPVCNVGCVRDSLFGH